MKLLFTLALLFTASSALAHQEDRPITSEVELRDWCEMQSHAHFIAQGITPYNWSASFWSEVNTLKVKGEWRVESRNAVVECAIQRGAPAHYAIMAIH